MTDTCVQIVDGKRGGGNSNVLLNGFRYIKCKVNKNGSVIWTCRVPGCKCKDFYLVQILMSFEILVRIIRTTLILIVLQQLFW